MKNRLSYFPIKEYENFSKLKNSYLYLLSDDEFDDLLARVEEDLENKKCQEFTVLFEVYQKLLFLSSEGIYKKDEKEILKNYEKYLNDKFDSNDFSLFIKEDDTRCRNYFYGNEDKETIRIKKVLLLPFYKIYLKFQKEQAEKEIKNFISSLHNVNNFETAFKTLFIEFPYNYIINETILSQIDASLLSINEKLLNNISASDFVNTFLSLNHYQQIMEIISKFGDVNEFRVNHQFFESLIKEIDNRPKRYSYLRLQNLRFCINQLLTRIRKSKASTQP